MIRLEAVARVFRVGAEPVRALDGVDLDIADGEYVAVMGPSGSGKSTLLNIIGLLDRPTTGRYLLDGREVSRLADAEQARLRRQKIGFVFQFFHLVPRLSAAQNLELPLLLAGVEPAERTPRVEAMLATMGLAARADHRPDQLSGGERQRVAIGRAAVTEPRIVLADEPTGNLDRASGHQVIETLEALNRSRGMTLILVTHDPALGARAPRRLAMSDGRVVGDTGVRACASPMR